MKAVHFSAFGGPMGILDVPDPAPPPQGVVLAVEATGLCRSDWHGWMGHDPDITLPHVPGHELAGTIVARGAGVRRWKEGERVTLPFVCGCGTCPQCNAGHQQVCDHQFQPGFTGWGSFAEYVAIDYADGNLVALSPEVSSVTAAALGCRFVTAYRALIDQGRLTAGEWVAVHGCGGVGLSAVMIAAAAGARVIAVDVNARALELAREFGAVALVHAEASAAGASAAEAVRELSGGGVDLSLDALGHPETCVQSVLSLRKRGRHVQVGLLLADQSRPAIPMDRVVAWELEILGSHGIQAHRYPALLAMMESGAVDPSRLVSRTISLEEAPAALASMDRFEQEGITVIDRFS
ncbi:MAG: alcohol dehydrogenase [Spirochaetaceae bacterium]|nr:MAG: alcohol dehydrogenase [Spirochaetaceae bacterium]